MTNAKHTPGPWKATPIGQGIGDYCIHAAGIPWQLAYLGENTQIAWPIEANARLIAAAPELLAALQAVLAVADNGDQPWWFDVPDRGGIDVDMVRAAIAKAEA